MKKTDCFRWIYSSRFGRRVYAGYSDLHGSWTAGFCDGYIQVSAKSYRALIHELSAEYALSRN
jgi:hypothetical protein